MAYSVFVKYVLEDYRSFKMNLEGDALEHIQNKHSEITIDEIQYALLDPDEVRKSINANPSSKCTVEIYYVRKDISKIRYTQVVVKFCPGGNFIVTAMTTNKIKSGDVIYKREE